ncbi:MAG: hypothetical protein ACRDOO_29030 [Actinomadura sp.]
MPARTGVRFLALRRWVAVRYGADPLHLLALLACFALAGYAAGRVVVAGIWVGFAIWFVGAAVIHDLLLYPLYALADVAAQRSPWRRRAHQPTQGRPRGAVPWPPWINYLRVPLALSGLLLLVWFPLILRRAAERYRASVGLDPSPYLGRWLLVTGVLFAGSALAYALRLRRSRAGRGAAATARVRPDRSDPARAKRTDPGRAKRRPDHP